MRRPITYAAFVALFVASGTLALAPPLEARPSPGSERVPQPVPPPDPKGDIDPERPPDAEIELQAVPVRPIRFPVARAASVANNFGAYRDGCTRRHMGVDIFAPKLRPLLAAMDGHVTWLRTDAGGRSGNGVGFRIAASPVDLRIRWQMNCGTASDRARCGGWNGDGIATPGVRRGQLVLPRSFWSSGAADLTYTYGAPTDQIVAGDWNGDGVDTLGALRGSKWLLTDRHGVGAATSSFAFRRPGDRAIAGDWNADGVDTAGGRRRPTCAWLQAAVWRSDSTWVWPPTGPSWPSGRPETSTTSTR